MFLRPRPRPRFLAPTHGGPNAPSPTPCARFHRYTSFRACRRPTHAVTTRQELENIANRVNQQLKSIGCDVTEPEPINAQQPPASPAVHPAEGPPATPEGRVVSTLLRVSAQQYNSIDDYRRLAEALTEELSLG